MKKVTLLLLAGLMAISILGTGCDGCAFERGHGKYGQCQGITKKGTQCKNSAGKTGYCGKHNPY